MHITAVWWPKVGVQPDNRFQSFPMVRFWNAGGGLELTAKKEFLKMSLVQKGVLLKHGDRTQGVPEVDYLFPIKW